MPRPPKSTAKTKTGSKAVKPAAKSATRVVKQSTASRSSATPQKVKKVLMQNLKSSEAVANFPAIVRQVPKNE